MEYKESIPATNRLELGCFGGKQLTAACGVTLMSGLRSRYCADKFCATHERFIMTLNWKRRRELHPELRGKLHPKRHGKPCARDKSTHGSTAKTIIVTALALVFGAANSAYAYRLAPKWSQDRAIANELGDLAKTGDMDAFARLKNMAATGSAPAEHNMGWLYDGGFPDHPVDKENACKWFFDASTRDYPPSMHAFALCQFAESKGRGSQDLEEKWGLGLLHDAAKAGWTASAVYLSEYLLNATLLSRVTAAEVYDLAEQGLKTDPTPSEKMTLSYFQGMAVIFGAAEINSITGDEELNPMNKQRIYRDGERALRNATSDGHPASEQELPKIRSNWALALMEDATTWKPPGRLAQDCYERVKDPAEKRYIPGSCAAEFRLSSRQLETYRENADYLVGLADDDIKPGLLYAIEDLDQRSAIFRAERPIWKEQFLPAYVKRVNDGDWP